MFAGFAVLIAEFADLAFPPVESQTALKPQTRFPSRHLALPDGSGRSAGGFGNK
jgi:hypothetical protein